MDPQLTNSSPSPLSGKHVSQRLAMEVASLMSEESPAKFSSSVSTQPKIFNSNKKNFQVEKENSSTENNSKISSQQKSPLHDAEILPSSPLLPSSNFPDNFTNSLQQPSIEFSQSLFDSKLAETNSVTSTASATSQRTCSSDESKATSASLHSSLNDLCVQETIHKDADQLLPDQMISAKNNSSSSHHLSPAHNPASMSPLNPPKSRLKKDSLPVPSSPLSCHLFPAPPRDVYTPQLASPTDTLILDSEASETVVESSVVLRPASEGDLRTPFRGKNFNIADSEDLGSLPCTPLGTLSKPSRQMQPYRETPAQLGISCAESSSLPSHSFQADSQPDSESSARYLPSNHSSEAQTMISTEISCGAKIYSCEITTTRTQVVTVTETVKYLPGKDGSMRTVTVKDESAPVVSTDSSSQLTLLSELEPGQSFQAWLKDYQSKGSKTGSFPPADSSFRHKDLQAEFRPEKNTCKEEKVSNFSAGVASIKRKSSLISGADPTPDKNAHKTPEKNAKKPPHPAHLSKQGGGEDREGASLAGTPSRQIEMGQSVLAKWRDQNFYFGNVTKILKNGKHQVSFSDGSRLSVFSADILPTSWIDEQDVVMAIPDQFDGEGIYEEGVIVGRTGEGYRIRFTDDDSEHICKRENVMLPAESAGKYLTFSTPSKPRGEDPLSSGLGGRSAIKKAKLCVQEDPAQMSPACDSSSTASGSVFHGIHFILTGVVNKEAASTCLESAPAHPSQDSIAHLITTGGGVIIDNIALFAELTLYRKCFVISDQPRRTAKYMVGPAVRIPCLKPAWISDCSLQRSLLPIGDYLLPYGATLGGENVFYCESQELMLPLKKRVFYDSVFHIYGSEQFRAELSLIVRCGGGSCIAKLPGAVVDSQFFCSFIVGDAEPALWLTKKAKILGIPIVSVEFIIQCLFSSTLLLPKDHPAFTSFSTKS